MRVRNVSGLVPALLAIGAEDGDVILNIAEDTS